MDYHKDRVRLFATFCLLFLGLLYMFILARPFFLLQNYQCRTSLTSNTTRHTDELESASPGAATANKTNNVTRHIDELESALAGAATASKTVIITIINKAYVEGDKPMLDLFLDSLWLGEGTWDLIDNLLLVTVDQTSYDRCKFLKLHCYKLETEGVEFDREKLYMSKDFINMMWRRTLFLGDVVKRGYSYIFTDADVMWLRNPFLRLSPDESVDLQISVDRFNGDQWSINPINTGFYIIRSNHKTISLLDSWYAKKNASTGLKEQDVLDEMMRQGVFKKLGLRVRFLDTRFFSGFCQNSRDFGAVTTVHSNCCRTISAKVADLTAVLRDWKRFRKSSSPNDTSVFKWSNHRACVNSWRH